MIFFSHCLKSILLYIRKSKILSYSRKAGFGHSWPGTDRADPRVAYWVKTGALGQTQAWKGCSLGSLLEEAATNKTLTREAVWQQPRPWVSLWIPQN